MSLSRNTPSASARGVFIVDPSKPPAPPPGARAVEIRNQNGDFIAWVMVIGEHADEHFYAQTWAYVDHRDPVTPPAPSSSVSSSLRLIP